MPSEQEIQYLFELPIEQLYVRVAQDILKLSFPPDGAKKEVLQWIDQNADELRDFICNHPLVLKYLIDDKEPDHAQLAKLLADTYIATHLGVPYASIIVLILRIGLRTFCNSQSPK